MTSSRQIIFECRTGSHLYGTNTPASDEDFTGVFLPSVEDLLGVGNCPTEWALNEKRSEGPRNAAGDVDRKYFSLKRFLDLATQGQPAQLEMLFAPTAVITKTSPAWEQVLAARAAFVSQLGVKPFLGFAMAQAHKATIKGENLTTIRRLIATSEEIVEGHSRALVSEWRPRLEADGANFVVNDHGFPQIEVAHRQWDIGVLVKTLLESLRLLQAKYGTRVNAAAAFGYDFKSLSHAYRLLGEAEEFLATGRITLPRPNAVEILAIKRGEVPREWFDYLTARLEHIETVLLPASPLPEQPGRGAINALCIRLHREVCIAG